MEFLVCEKQEGYGCDHTIGCGMNFYFMEAKSVWEAKEKTIWPDGRDDEHNTLEGDNALELVLIVPSEHVVTVDIENLKSEIIATREDRNKKGCPECQGGWLQGNYCPECGRRINR